MTDLSEAGSYSTDCCTVETHLTASKDTAEKTKTLSVDIVSDPICPWCYAAKRHFGRGVGDKGVAADLAHAAGVDRARAGVSLAGPEGADEVAGAEAASKHSGMNGVPTFVINGRPAFSGAQRAELMLAHMLDAVVPA